VLPDEVRSSSFTEFVEDNELRLRQALMASFGPEAGRDAAAEALAYGWEHWDRVHGMRNPVGYLFRVGQSRGSKMARRRKPVLPVVVAGSVPWMSPSSCIGSPAAIPTLSRSGPSPQTSWRSRGRRS
jgi:DNA-directed RNA polymerase specialized sigma24 family protein